ncbi:MAG: SDR family NAD(P)-dependent oxidoreductase [Mycobacteriales bacterium]
MTSGVWRARYPDLAGKVALVTGDFRGLVDIVTELAANGVPMCVVAGDRSVVNTALTAAESSTGGVVGITAPPAEADTWQRVLPHAEQRLGPIDILVAAGSAPTRERVIGAALPDMAARRRGVIVEVGGDVPEAVSLPGVRRRSVVPGATTSTADVAAAVVMCASDVLAAAVAKLQLDD